MVGRLQDSQDERHWEQPDTGLGPERVPMEGRVLGRPQAGLVKMYPSALEMPWW